MSEQKRQNLGQIVMLAFCFLLLFSAFMPAQNLATNGQKEDGQESLGFQSLATIQVTAGLFSFVSAPIVEKLGSRKSMLLGSCCQLVWILCSLLPATKKTKDKTGAYSDQCVYSVMIVSAAINGFGAAIIWVAQGKQISDCACEENKGTQNGIFYLIFSSSMLIGNLLGGFVAGKLDQTYFQIFCGSCSLLGTLMFLFLKKPIPQQKNIQLLIHDDSEEENDINHQDDQEKPQKSVQEIIKETAIQSVDRKMMTTHPFTVFIGMTLGLITGFLPTVIGNSIDNTKQVSPITTEDKNLKILIAMTFLGPAEIICSGIIGFLVDKLGLKAVFKIHIVTVLVTVAVTCIALVLNRMSPIWYVVVFLWGWTDSTNLNLMNSICGFEYESKVTPFAVFRTLQCISTFTFLMLSSAMLKPPLNFIFVGIVFSTGIFAIVIFILVFKLKKI